MAENNEEQLPEVVRVPGVVTFDDVEGIFMKYGIQFNGENVENTKLCAVIKHLEAEIEKLKK